MNQTAQTQEALTTIVKSTVVSLTIENAFRLFTTDISSWWPLSTHSVFGEDATACYLEGKVGGRIYELHNDQRQSDWGKVLIWEPPHRLVFTLHPGRTPDYATEVEVIFQEEAGVTRLTLTHRGWERCGGQMSPERNGYERGWEIILNKYIQHAGQNV
jgi:uncharacterized protein YndB with AHSA1/START domain